MFRINLDGDINVVETKDTYICVYNTNISRRKIKIFYSYGVEKTSTVENSTTLQRHSRQTTRPGNAGDISHHCKDEDQSKTN